MICNYLNKTKGSSNKLHKMTINVPPENIKVGIWIKKNSPTENI